jgi:glutamine synthetase
VHRHAGLLRAAIASAANDHRLGANEAPPAIISIFLGEQLTDVFEQIKAGGAKSSKSKGVLDSGVITLPQLPKDAGDRNRTSPFAFCGNRFEFRAVGGSQSIGGPLIALNTAITESLDFVATKLEAAVASGTRLNQAIQDVLAEIMKENGGVIFNGNGYTPEWHAEAEKRGLPNYRTTVDALAVLNKPETVKVFEKYDVLTPRELHSRYEIYLEQYCKYVNVEAKLTTKIAKTTILPAALGYLGSVGQSIASAKAGGLSVSTKLGDQVSSLTAELEKSIGALEAATAHTAKDVLDEAKHLRDKVLPAMLAVRSAADSLEGVVGDSSWPLPTYQEMLFIR